jgi:hypothetical protein
MKLISVVDLVKQGPTLQEVEFVTVRLSSLFICLSYGIHTLAVGSACRLCSLYR